MTIILYGKNSTLLNKIQNTLDKEYLSYLYTDNSNININELIILIDQDLHPFEEKILEKMRQSTYILGVWAKSSSTKYLSKNLEDLFDSIICEDNIPLLNSILEKKKVILQTPDCLELETKEIIRVNCKTGKRLK
ncbi:MULTISPECIES: hypothetical protein [Acinetobacter]|jgi:hypothetical protein|uniref:Uncharacterized protein n=1 Tax=Acinetobacter pittii TaxID=48296 RepID=A0A242UA34_ACIPI|nr:MULTISPECIES: hypothetical protein [Acinetobacter]EXS21233.1 hypothetical protein J658_3739 [Acinetobacter baumannii 573719]MBJ8471978.1 hypothetical protein [Acinetobacter pittii]MBJ8502589.1 hypothetical protein [Acinetobacter pittii]MBJ9893322.1 hypothetical protein [Acinetobacter pittii]MCU4479869.1 hypothetical protein [Acinetobacter sp. WU_MDCI_Abxd143]